MSEEEIKLLVKAEVKQEINASLKDLHEEISTMKNSIDRIERILVGDPKFKDIGYAEMIVNVNRYVTENQVNHIVERGLCAIDFKEQWDKEGNWDRLKKMIENDKVKAALYTFLGLGTIAGVINIVQLVTTIVQQFVK